MKKLNPNHLWIILGAYGVWFAILSGLEEISSGKIWKAVASLLLGVTIYYLIEQRHKS